MLLFTVVSDLFAEMEDGGSTGNGAMIVSTTVPPAILSRLLYTAEVVVRNTGTTTWSRDAQYGLAVTSDPCALFIGGQRIEMPADLSVPPGGHITFWFQLRSNDEARQCSIEFQMVQEFVEYFGEPINIPVRVKGRFAPFVRKIKSPDITNQFRGSFGAEMAVIGDALLVGETDQHEIHVLNANTSSPDFGSLLFSLVDPGDKLSFGAPLAADGFDYIVGGASTRVGPVPGILSFGLIHLFDSATGSLLKTIEDPHLSFYNQFGTQAAGSGERILIGAPGDDAGGLDAGTVYLYDGDHSSPDFGDLLLTLNNPNPADDPLFGSAVGFVGARWLIASSHSIHVYDGDPASPTYGSPLRATSIPSDFSSAFRLFTGIFVLQSNVSGARFAVYDSSTQELIRTVDSDSGFNFVTPMGTDFLVKGFPQGVVFLIDGITGETKIIYRGPPGVFTPYNPDAIVSIDGWVLIGKGGSTLDLSTEKPGTVFIFQAFPPPPNGARSWRGYR